MRTLKLALVSPAPAPLHRLASTTAQMANRNTICGTAVFTPDGTITAALAPYDDPTKTPLYNETDSCDEYPFAATYESGAMQTGADGQPKSFVTTGADCVQGSAMQTGNSGADEASDWSIINVDPTTVTGNPATSPRIRAHVPKKLNTSLGERSAGPSGRTDCSTRTPTGSRSPHDSVIPVAPSRQPSLPPGRRGSLASLYALNWL